MTPLATSFLCVAFLFAIHAVLHLLSHRVEPERRSLLAFALGCLCLSAYSLGTALVVDATALPQACTGQALQCISATLAITALLSVERDLGAARSSGFWLYSWLVNAFNLAVLGLGLYFSASAVPPSEYGLSWAPRLVQAQLAPLGALAAVAPLPALGYAVLQLLRRAPYSPEARALLPMALVALPALLHDSLVRYAGLRSVPLFDYTALVLVLTTAGLARRRFAQSLRTLTGQTRELRSSRRALQRLQSELDQTRQLAELGEFTAIIAHEVRNPLAIIKNVASRLRGGERPEAEEADLFAILDEEAARLDVLVVNLATLTGPLSPHPRSLEAGALFEAVAQRARQGAEPGRHVAFEFSIAPDAQQIRADPRLLRMALGNLVDNAMQAMGSDGTLQLSVTREPATDAAPGPIAIAVRDTGPGMPADAAEKAFEPFFTTRAKGTGLGLTIVHRIAEAHGGGATLDTGPGGTTVTLRFPA